MNHPAMYPKIAVVDPELTLTVLPQVTASTGLMCCATRWRAIGA